MFEISRADDNKDRQYRGRSYTNDGRVPIVKIPSFKTVLCNCHISNLMRPYVCKG